VRVEWRWSWGWLRVVEQSDYDECFARGVDNDLLDDDEDFGARAAVRGGTCESQCHPAPMATRCRRDRRPTTATGAYLGAVSRPPSPAR
jgi:hypothetical protein